MTTGGASTPAWPTPRQAAYSLLVLTVVVMFTVLDKQLLALMIEPVKKDLDITDTQVALLVGAAFSLSYAIAGLPIARLADRVNRRNLVAICLAVWSVATMACGMSQNYWGLLFARMGIGIGESGYGPAAWSIVSDSFKRERVAFATGVLGIGAMAGTGLAMLMGGMALQLVAGFPSELPLLGTMHPWQWAFIVIGAPGVLWALVMLTSREPARRGPGAAKQVVPIREVARFMGKEWRMYLATIGGTCAKNLLAIGPNLWMPSLMVREFGWSVPKAGIYLGVITIVCAPIGMIAGGKWAEAWTRRGYSDANLRVVLYALYLAVPVSIFMSLMPTEPLVLAVFAVQVVATGLGFGPGIASFQIVTPGGMRAQVSSVMQFSANVLGLTISPLVVALFTDYLFHDPAQLKYSIALNAVLFGPLSIWVVVQGMAAYRRCYEHAVRENY